MKESTNASFKICALIGSLDGSDDEKIICIKYGQCKDLFERLTNLKDNDVDLLKKSQKTKFLQKMSQN